MCVRYGRWRLCRWCIPTQQKLIRHVDCELNCPLCDEEIEDDVHVFFKCAVARASWTMAGLEHVIANRQQLLTNAADFVFDLCSTVETNEVGRVAVLLWCIWQNRNDWIWNAHKRDATQLGQQAYVMWQEWYSVHNRLHNSNVIPSVQRNVSWEKPSQGGLNVTLMRVSIVLNELPLGLVVLVIVKGISSKLTPDGNNLL
ncbi:hypothetical protein A2U01_0028120 [Trifolium medium]|uniref:Reverse transcriptase zinc-binding domain-containing protein n=1 Tax=Trifolium medium TaxID=97028 RepID=A0A392P4Y0_9FABA|nr:hypothetical protein [Trifolium medium]